MTDREAELNPYSIYEPNLRAAWLKGFRALPHPVQPEEAVAPSLGKDYEPTMNIYAKPGTRVRFRAGGGYEGEKKSAEKAGFTKNQIYTVKRCDIGHSKTEVLFDEIEGRWNSCLFADAAPEEAVARDAALWRQHVAKLDALVLYCPTCCAGFIAEPDMTRDEVIFECGRTAGRSESRKLRDALTVAHDHLDMGALRISHAKDAAAIDAALSRDAGGVNHG